MNDLQVSIIQTDLKWEDKPANLSHIGELISQIEETDLIVLSEMFSTGFSMNVEDLSETMYGQTIKWMKQISYGKNAAVTGSIIVKENGNYFNRLLFVKPDGKIEWYDKRHLFAMGEEHLHYSQGNRKLIVDWKGWKIYPLICYDLRFPVWSRNSENYDLLIYVANWPAPRQHVWESLLVARAIENQSYVIGVNRVGKDGRNLNYIGGSASIDPKGESHFLTNEEKVENFVISYKNLHDFRKKFPVFNDMDNFELKI